jgi:hypothetical protein
MLTNLLITFVGASALSLFPAWVHGIAAWPNMAKIPRCPAPTSAFPPALKPRSWMKRVPATPPQSQNLQLQSNINHQTKCVFKLLLML